MGFPDLGRMVLEIQIGHHLGKRATYFDIPAAVNAVVDRLGFVDLEEIDPLVLEEILDGNRKPV